jgi:hypothetical protein
MQSDFQQDAAGWWIKKDPAAVLDYTLDWSTDGWLGIDTIASVVWAVPAGITQTAASNTTTGATVWLSGGTLATSYTVTCRITTAAGRTDERSFRIIIKDR